MDSGSREGRNQPGPRANHPRRGEQSCGGAGDREQGSLRQQLTHQAVPGSPKGKSKAHLSAAHDVLSAGLLAMEEPAFETKNDMRTARGRASAEEEHKSDRTARSGGEAPDDTAVCNGSCAILLQRRRKPGKTTALATEK